MANPVVDRLVVEQEAQSESEKALIPELLDSDEKKMPRPDVFSDYVEFANKQNSKKEIVEDDALKCEDECIDHLMVVEDADPAPEPTVGEATIMRRATRKRKREEGEVFHDPFMEWMDYNWKMGIYPELDDAPKPLNWKWEHPSPENHLPEWDGRFDENYDTDAMENGGIYGFSSDSEIDEYFDLEMLGVNIEKMEVDEVEPPKTPTNPDVPAKIAPVDPADAGDS